MRVAGGRCGSSFRVGAGNFAIRRGRRTVRVEFTAAGRENSASAPGAPSACRVLRARARPPAPAAALIRATATLVRATGKPRPRYRDPRRQYRYAGTPVASRTAPMPERPGDDQSTLIRTTAAAPTKSAGTSG